MKKEVTYKEVVYTVADVKKALAKLGTKEKAKTSAWFFKTGKGQYGEGDVFIGVTVPEQRQVVKTVQLKSLRDIDELIQSPIHEHRLTALLMLVSLYKNTEKEEDVRARAKKQKEIYNWYLKHTKHINNWDLVDSSARDIVGAYVWGTDKQAFRALKKLATSKQMWERRIAIIATHYFIQKGDMRATYTIAEMLLSDAHDLMHKAVGWMLREAGKRELAQGLASKPLKTFLKKHVRKLPRTTLRYAIERFSEVERKVFLKL